jgi:hypothetical protein
LKRPHNRSRQLKNLRRLAKIPLSLRDGNVKKNVARAKQELRKRMALLLQRRPLRLPVMQTSRAPSA